MKGIGDSGRSRDRTRVRFPSASSGIHAVPRRIPRMKKEKKKEKGRHGVDVEHGHGGEKGVLSRGELYGLGPRVIQSALSDPL